MPATHCDTKTLQPAVFSVCKVFSQQDATRAHRGPVPPPFCLKIQLVRTLHRPALQAKGRRTFLWKCSPVGTLSEFPSWPASFLVVLSLLSWSKHAEKRPKECWHEGGAATGRGMRVSVAPCTCLFSASLFCREHCKPQSLKC